MAFARVSVLLGGLCETPSCIGALFAVRAVSSADWAGIAGNYFFGTVSGNDLFRCQEAFSYIYGVHSSININK